MILLGQAWNALERPEVARAGHNAAFCGARVPSSLFVKITQVDSQARIEPARGINKLRSPLSGAVAISPSRRIWLRFPVGCLQRGQVERLNVVFDAVIDRDGNWRFANQTVKKLAHGGEPYCFVRRPHELDKRVHELRGVRSKALAHILDRAPRATTGV
jgi:hypothetical protein